MKVSFKIVCLNVWNSPFPIKETVFLRVRERERGKSNKRLLHLKIISDWQMVKLNLISLSTFVLSTTYSSMEYIIIWLLVPFKCFGNFLDSNDWAWLIHESTYAHNRYLNCQEQEYVDVIWSEKTLAESCDVNDWPVMKSPIRTSFLASVCYLDLKICWISCRKRWCQN